MSPEAHDILGCFEIEGYDPSLEDGQPMVEVEFPQGTINVEGAENITRGWLSYLFRSIVLTYEHPSWGVCGTIKTKMGHTVGTHWVKDGDFMAFVSPNGCKEKE